MRGLGARRACTQRVRQNPLMSSGTPDTRLGSTDCERIREGRIAQPVNTVTSLAFVAAGAAVVVGARRHGSGHMPEVVAFSALMALVGAGSVAFHGPQPRGARWMHDWPIAGLLAVTAATPMVRRMRGRAALPGWSGRRGAVLAGVVTSALASYAGGRTGARTCCPDCAFQLHGAWHVLTATGFALAAEILYDAPAEG